MAQASRVLAVARPSEGHRSTTEGTGSEKATKCKYSTTQREEGHRAKGMPSKATQGKGNFIAVGAMSVEAERNTLLAECNRLRAANEDLSNHKNKNDMNLVELITKYQSDATPEQMVMVTKIIGKFVAMHATEEDLLKLYKEIYGVVGNGHFNDFFAEAQIKKMVFEDDNDVEHRAPYFTMGKAQEIYETVKNEIKPYNQWDFAVVLNMIYSDNYNLMKKWFPEDSEEQLMDKMVDLAVNWLRDDDNPYGHCKAWGYFNH